MKVYLQCCDCGDVKAIKGCIPEVQLIEDDRTKVYASDNCGGMRCAQLKQSFGATDAEHIALKLYDMFHGEDTRDPHERGWSAYSRQHGDYVVEKFRHMGIMVQRMHEAMKFGEPDED